MLARTSLKANAHRLIVFVIPVGFVAALSSSLLHAQDTSPRSVEAQSSEARPTEIGPSIVRQVDHIRIASRGATGLFSLLTETLQLPIAWPMADHGGFVSGGVAVANLNLEIVQDNQAADGKAPRWTGFAFEPERLPLAIRELDARGVNHGDPAPLRQWQNGWFRTRWTTVSLPEVSSDEAEIFLCEYSDEPTVKRRELLNRLHSNQGGPLSVRAVREIVVGARDLNKSQLSWQKLLAPAQKHSDAHWAVGAGPEIRLVQSASDGIAGLTIEVESLKQAREFVNKQALLGPERSGSLELAGAQLNGLNITLIEREEDADPQRHPLNLEPAWRSPR
jgi:hypothetical protein